MSFDVVVRRDDTLPVFEKSFYSDGEPINLTGYTVTWEVRNLDGAVLINEPAEFVNVSPFNKVRYEFTSTYFTALVNTTYAFGQFVAVLNDSRFTVPNNRPMSIMVTDTSRYEYSYSGNPAGRPIDRFRFLLQDTNLERAMFTDSEIEFLLSENENVYEAAAEGAETQAAKYTELKDKTVGPLSIRYGTSSDRLTALANSLRRRRSRLGAAGALAITTQVPRDPWIRLNIGANVRPGYSYPDNLLGEEEL